MITLSEVEDAYNAMSSAPSEEVSQFMSECISSASTKGKVPITIVTGVPGSGKARVCRYVALKLTWSIKANLEYGAVR